jgi:hypothetical protein
MGARVALEQHEVASGQDGQLGDTVGVPVQLYHVHDPGVQGECRSIAEAARREDAGQQGDFITGHPEDLDGGATPPGPHLARLHP